MTRVQDFLNLGPRGMKGANPDQRMDKDGATLVMRAIDMHKKQGTAVENVIVTTLTNTLALELMYTLTYKSADPACERFWIHRRVYAKLEESML